MKSINSFRLRCSQALIAAMLFVVAGVVLADPPGRVARLAYLGGEVSFAPAGEDAWFDAHLNRPLVHGDRLWTGRNGRVELQLGGAVARLDRNTGFEFLNLDDELAQIQLTEGTINLRVDYIHPGQIYEIDTPTLAFVVSQPGEYRLDVSGNADMTQVTVFDGAAEVYGEYGRSQRVFANSSTRFFDPGLRDVERVAMPRADEFDRWAFARNDRYLRSPSRQYVSEELIGYADLDEYGSWRHVADYGHVWFPRRVAAGWAPYRDGHWSWIEPWGWTWVDNAPWGFAPFHYGRWVYVSSGWGWLPGPRNVRPVYAPALVAFVGGSNWSVTVTSGPPIGWFPLGPRDVYVPWYRSSRDYFGRVNVHNTTIINNTYVTNIYNDYYVQGRPLRRDFTFRGAANAMTVVPRDSFVSAQNAAEAMARSRLRPAQLGDAELLTRAPVAPTRDSLVAGASRNIAPPARSFERGVIARTRPAEPVAPFNVRQSAIVRNGGEPLAADQMRRVNAENAKPRSRNIAVVGQPGGDTSRAPAAAAGQGTPAPAARGTPGSTGEQVRAPAATPGATEPRSRGLPASENARSRAADTSRATPQAQPEQGVPLPRTRAPAGNERQGAPVTRDQRTPGTVAPAARERTAAPARGIAPTAPQTAPRTTTTVREAPATRSTPSAPPAQRSTPAPAARSAPASAPRAAPAPAPRSAAPSAPVRSAPAQEPRSRSAPEPERPAAPARGNSSDRTDSRGRDRARQER
ncbi:DUF6600 domain-containing protein [Pseudofulvimonas gallinarii]|uniref:FecR family protein n=2 Tax=Pseudofulvimonas gallinarii TaxID=634155 RepID=A0A4S3KTS9_9GAMM|nr:DUF6600 domain-containing protein [Pseudofulvimonas gallinarii]TCT01430.1 FecR family protein [Pseudofulvimonas gallinarii]THD12582.1 hypothetical protein B1808_12225 [Pseudofulvimonas gallinarii]